jgi:hypothetical protein
MFLTILSPPKSIISPLLAILTLLTPAFSASYGNLSTFSLSPSTVTALVAPSTAIVRTTTYLTVVPYSNSTQTAPGGSAVTAIRTGGSSVAAAASQPTLQSDAVRAVSGEIRGTLVIGTTALLLLEGLW